MSSPWPVDLALCPTDLRDMLRHLLSEDRRAGNQWSMNPFLFFWRRCWPWPHGGAWLIPWSLRQRFFGAA